MSDDGAYLNNRRQGWSYDAAGNNTLDFSYHQTFDAANQYTNAVGTHMVGDGSAQWPNTPNLEITQGYDGGGQSLKRNQISRMNDYDLETGQYNGVAIDNQTTYYLRSTVLGGAIVDEMARDWQNNAAKMEGYVYAGAQRIARQTAGMYEHHNPETGSWVTTTAWNRYLMRQERDPDGGQVPINAPPSPNYVSNNFGSPLFIEGGDPSDYSGGHEIDGMPVSDSEFARRTGDGSGAVTVSVQGTDGKWHQGGPQTRFFPGPFGTSVWVDTSEYFHANHDDPDDDVVRIHTDLKEKGFWKNGASGFNFADGFFGGGPQNPAQTDHDPRANFDSPEAYKKEVLDKYLPKINECVPIIFGIKAKKIGTLTAENAPALDITRNSKQLAKMSDTTSKTALGTNDPNKGRHGTVYIASNFFDYEAPGPLRADWRAALLGGFFHEWANILSAKVAGGNERKFGNPAGVGRAKDTDSGANFQRCVDASTIHY